MAKHLKKDRTPTGPLWWIRRIVAWMAIFATGAALLVAVVIPRVGGATPYAILTGSMQPTYEPGTLAVVRPVPVEDIAIGTVITYQLESGTGTTVTHRVVGVAVDGRGERVFTTQGDANNVADTKVVRPVQIRGAVWYSVPLLGYANRYLTASERSQLAIGVAGLLLLYAVWALVSGLRDRRRERREPVVAPKHLAPTPARAARTPRRGRLRPLLPLVCLTALAGLGVANTFAYWSDSGTVETGSFSAGVLDLKLDAGTVQDSITLSNLSLATMVPGESVARSFTVRNTAPSNVPFTYTATGSASGGIAAHLTFRAYLGGSPTNATVNSLRTGTCTGTATGAATTWAGSTTVIPASPVQQLAPGGSQTVCVVATLPATAASGAQGTTGSAVVTFTAVQLGAP